MFIFDVRVSLMSIFSSNMLPKITYYTSYNKIIYREYGRNVQRLVEQALQIPDRNERTKFAHTIIEIMGQLNPHLRNVEDFKHKLWDHLHIIADYQLDISSPYPMPKREVVNRRPAPLPYPKSKIKNRQYGRNLQMLVEKAATMPYANQQIALAQTALGYMKTIQRNKTNNQDSINEEMIKGDLLRLSDGEINLGSEQSIYHQRQQKSKYKKRVFAKASEPKNLSNRPNKNKNK